MNSSDKEYKEALGQVPGLKEVVKKFIPKISETELYLYMEFVLHGLAEYSLLSKFRLEHGLQFRDMLSSMFSLSSEEEDDDFKDDLYK